MQFALCPVQPGELSQMKLAMQESFQKGYEREFGATQDVILPEADIDQSLREAGAAAYQAVVDGEMAGGAVVVIDERAQHNHLALLFVREGMQGRGIGRRIWLALERLYPQTRIWETCTPYFERRNIHFYVNVCGFHITEFYCAQHPMPGMPEEFTGDGGEGMFRFEKVMK